MQRLLISLVLMSVSVLVLAPSRAAADPLVVTVREGAVQGSLQDGVRVFRNIPYAAPPVGERRWRAPAPAPAWTGVRDGTRNGAGCDMPDWTRAPAATRTAGPGWTMWTREVPPDPNTSEDCLHLNIWAPAEPTRRAPVMVFIHGAGGSNAIPWWDGTAFARDGVVLVVINYRQMNAGNFQHPALTRDAAPGEASGNYQVQDQVAALRWVRANIAAFGGDPGNVTIFGQSAGGTAVLRLMALPQARGLFHKAIAQSAGGAWWVGPGTTMSRAEGEALGVSMAAQAGLGPDATAAQLRALPRGAMPWMGVFSSDDRYLTPAASPQEAMSRMADVPLMIGWTSLEGSSVRFGHDEVIANTPPAVRAAYAPEGLSGADLAYALYTDSHVGAPARWMAGQLSRGAPTYLYHFSYVRSEIRGQVRGAAHGDDLTYVFDTWSRMFPRAVLNDEDRAVTRMVHSCWVTFARTGRPQCEGAPAWPRYSPRDDRLMDLTAAVPVVRQRFRRAQLDAQDAARTDGAETAQRSFRDLLARQAALAAAR